MNEQHQQVMSMAMAAYDAFYQAMRDRFGHAWPRKQYAGKYWGTFLTIGKHCFNYQWTPEEYVEYVINKLHKEHHYITPYDLNKSQILDGYTADLARSKVYRTDPLAEWARNIDSLLLIMEQAQATEVSVLRCVFTPFPAWFRLVYPEQFDEMIFSAYGDSGRAELNQHKQLRSFLRKVVPKQFARLETHWGKFGDVEVTSS